MHNQPFRHEYKYLCSEAQLSIIECRLKGFLDFDKHAKNGVYNIRSLYFDNYANKCFFENENGVNPREKFRIRIYNSSDKIISLECKRKENDKTLKSSCKITKQQFSILTSPDSSSVQSFDQPLTNKLLLLKKTQLYAPKIIVEYDRTPYVYPIGNVRITLDRNIRSSVDLSSFFNKVNYSRPILPSGMHLLEVKFDEFLPDFIKEILQLNTLQRSTFSKYYLCRKYSTRGLL